MAIELRHVLDDNLGPVTVEDIRLIVTNVTILRLNPVAKELIAISVRVTSTGVLMSGIRVWM